jgi:hypothetical protein
LNAFHALVETASRGYHETLTRVWLVLIASLRARDPRATSSEFVDAHGDRLGKEAVFAHYSRDHVMSVRARAMVIDPDVAPLPIPG